MVSPSRCMGWLGEGDDLHAWCFTCSEHARRSPVGISAHAKSRWLKAVNGRLNAVRKPQAVDVQVNRFP